MRTLPALNVHHSSVHVVRAELGKCAIVYAVGRDRGAALVGTPLAVNKCESSQP